MFLAQSTFWSAPSGSGELIGKIVLGLVLGFGLMAALLFAPSRARKPIVFTATFLAGLFYVLVFLWPQPVDRDPGELPLNPVESVGFVLQDGLQIVATFTNVLSAFMIGLGIYSLFRIHFRRLFKMQRDWVYSLVLLTSLFTIAYFGFADWSSRQTTGTLYDERANWTFIHYAKDLLFDGLLQQMDAAMFSIIAFFILSAAYRAFRVRSIEATILLATAFIVMLSFMGAVSFVWDNLFPADGLLANLRLSNIRVWLNQSVQTPSIRGIDFGVGIGALAMGLRLWLGLEKGSGAGG